MKSTLSALIPTQDTLAKRLILSEVLGRPLGMQKRGKPLVFTSIYPQKAHYELNKLMAQVEQEMLKQALAKHQDSKE